jgi:hypothetical protein
MGLKLPVPSTWLALAWYTQRQPVLLISAGTRPYSSIKRSLWIAGLRLLTCRERGIDSPPRLSGKSTSDESANSGRIFSLTATVLRSKLAVQLLPFESTIRRLLAPATPP